MSFYSKDFRKAFAPSLINRGLVHSKKHLFQFIPRPFFEDILYPAVYHAEQLVVILFVEPVEHLSD